MVKINPHTKKLRSKSHVKNGDTSGVEVNLKLLKKQAKQEIEKAGDLNLLNEVFKKYLGKRGKLTAVLRSLEKLPKAKRIKLGKEANELKKFLQKSFAQKKATLTEVSADKEDWIDISQVLKFN